MFTHTPRLTATLARLHAAITGTPSTAPERPAQPCPAQNPPAPQHGPSWPRDERHAPPVPTVALPAPSPAPLADVAPLDSLKRGPRALLELLHRLALEVLPTRAHPVLPSRLVLHLPQELLAAQLGVNRITVWRWTCELKDAGLLDARSHKGTTTHRAARVTRNTGTLYAVPLVPGSRPRLRFDDLKHEYRDLDADREAGRTAFRAVQQSSPTEGGEWFQQLKTWAVTPGQTDNPPLDSDCCTPGAAGLNSVQHVIHTLPLVAEAHPDKRAALVGTLGAALARLLDDDHSRRWYCSLIWGAWRAECEHRPGLQMLAAQLARLDADRREWPDLRSPAALLAARLT